MHLLKGLAAISFITLNTIGVWFPLTWWIVQLIWVRGDNLIEHRKKMDKIIWWWTKNNAAMFRALNTTKVSMHWRNRDAMSTDAWYLVVSNHQSWTDIVLLQSHLYGVIPPIKFFTKQQLIWVPGIGLAMYALGFPYVKRVTKAQIKANPKLRNSDRDNTLRACVGFKNHPTSILNFVEGTRRTDEKQARQGSEYKYLLRPKIGGLGYVIEGMDEYLDKLLDVTIAYPHGVPSFWEFLQGKCPEVVMEVTPHDIPDAIRSGEPAARRTELAQWLKTLWIAKDQRIESLTGNGETDINTPRAETA